MFVIGHYNTSERMKGLKFSPILYFCDLFEKMDSIQHQLNAQISLEEFSQETSPSKELSTPRKAGPLVSLGLSPPRTLCSHPLPRPSSSGPGPGPGARPVDAVQERRELSRPETWRA